MKNIAEYFRDLAAGDRFFGAEPPQPDPEMLQSIAEQTIKARVNAQLSDNGLVLRQDAASAAPAPSAIPPMAAVAAAAVAPQVAPAEAPAPVGVETVAEKLQRIRAVVSRETAQDALFSEDQHVDEFASETTAPLASFQDATSFQKKDSAPVERPAAEPQAEDVVVAEDTPEETSPDPVVEDKPETDTSEDALADTSTSFEDDEDTSSDVDLDATTEDASQDAVAEDSAEPENATSEQETLDASDAESSDAESDEALSDDTVEEDSVADVASETVEDSNSDTDTADTSTEVDDDPAAREEAAETAVDNVLGRVAKTDDSEDTTPRRRIVVQKITREDLKAAREKAAQAAKSKDEAASGGAVASEEFASQLTSDSELPPEQEEDLLRELAALQSEESDAAEMTFETDTQTEIDEDRENKMADEMAEVLAASKAEDKAAEDDLTEALSELVSEDADAYKKEEETAAREVRRARRDAITEDHEDDVERLISATTSRIDNDESSKRRASIAHLKAAVAATKADSSLTEAAQEQEARERDQYAEDLARVVRPERKTASGERSKTDRPTPLVLVSELRIDKDEADEDIAAEVQADEGSVRPRRITSKDLNAQEAAEDSSATAPVSDGDHANFAEYAASANALELPDLLEAAAAYYTYVESTEQFTRPMLMRKIASISARDGFSREAGLRSFGTLLREGKLVKGTDGKFVIAKTSRFTPEARYAGE